MTNLREAAQMALRALQESKPIDINDPAAFYRSAYAIQALRAALAQQENQRARDSLPLMVEALEKLEQRQKALAQPEQEPVAWIEEAKAIAAQCWCDSETSHIVMEPVLAEAVARRIAAWMETGSLHARNEAYWRDRALKAEEAAPPQREWQGLTEEDLSVCDGDGVILARYWEAKLREKNNG